MDFVKQMFGVCLQTYSYHAQRIRLWLYTGRTIIVILTYHPFGVSNRQMPLP